MKRTRTRAELEILFRNVPQAKRAKQDKSLKLGDAPSTVNGTHRAGKRKRGSSLTKLGQRTEARALTVRILDSDGIEVARVKTRVYKRNV